MLDWTVYRVLLEPRAPVHFGAHLGDMSRSEATLRSDSLFGALIEGIAATAGPDAAAGLVARFASGDPPWLHSGLLLARAGTLYYPRPFSVPRWPATEPGGRKRTRRARWITQGALARWWGNDGWEPTVSADGLLLAVDGEESVDDPLFADDRVARVTVARDTQSTALFTAGRTVFSPGVQLVVLVAAPSFPPELEGAFRYLEHAGIGGERSTGSGQVTVSSIEPSGLRAGAGPAGAYALSCVAPTAQDIESGIAGAAAAYAVISRRGWITSPAWSGYHTREVAMLQEGAVLPAGTADIPGRLVDVTPSVDDPGDRHPVFRYGFGLLMPIGASDGG